MCQRVVSLVEVEHEAGDKNCCEANIWVSIPPDVPGPGTLNGSENLGTYDVLDDGMCKTEF